MTDLALRFAAVQTIVRDLGRFALAYFNDRDKLGITMKGAQDWLTVADGAVETRFRAAIAELFPYDGVLGEEQGGGAAENLWVIDPIDGTANFAHGDRHWCISIGFMRAGRPELGVILAPALDEMYCARRGHGVTMNGAAIRASDLTDISRAAIEIGWSNRRPIEAYLRQLEGCYRAGAHVKRGASGALGLAHVALGRTDGYAEAHINAWDVAAGVVIAAEAGAYVSDFFAKPDALSAGNVMVCLAPGIASVARPLIGLD